MVSHVVWSDCRFFNRLTAFVLFDQIKGCQNRRCAPKRLEEKAVLLLKNISYRCEAQLFGGEPAPRA